MASKIDESISNKSMQTHEIRCKSDKDFFKKFRCKPENSITIDEQKRTEKQIEICYSDFLKKSKNNEDIPSLNREQHVKYLLKGLSNLPSSFECLDASRPWICYWILHALYLLDAKLDDNLTDNVIKFLNDCQIESGGFAGGPGQQAHLAPTYAAINALCTLDCDRALKIIRRKELLEWIKRLKNSNGSLSMHEDGEEDLRGTYCAITVAKLTNLEELSPDLFDNVAEWIMLCQTYEGGFGACPDAEAHGGYTYCGVASLKLLGKDSLLDVDSLLYWLVNKQMKFEGGFQGRTNKLVDSCYSFWQGGQFPIIQSILMEQDQILKNSKEWLFNQVALQEYILICCQVSQGGLIDKPLKNRDYYHTCYALSGLSISQHQCGNDATNICNYDDSLVNLTHPLFNISPSGVKRANIFFKIIEKIS